MYSKYLPQNYTTYMFHLYRIMNKTFHNYINIKLLKNTFRKDEANEVFNIQMTNTLWKTLCNDSFQSFLTNSSYLQALFCWYYGPLFIADLLQFVQIMRLIRMGTHFQSGLNKESNWAIFLGTFSSFQCIGWFALELCLRLLS